MRCRLGAVAGAAVLALAMAACGSSAGASKGGGVTVHVGFFPNLTHAPALVGVAQGTFAKDLGPDKLDASQTFNAGPAESQALLSGSIDIGFMGPSSVVTAYTQSHGAVQIISGAASGGAALVVKPSINSPADLKGQTLASPQLGNTQDVSLKYWLQHQHLPDVKVTPSTSGNGTVVTEFKSGAIAGAWVPQPYVAQLVAEGGHVLVDEKSLWPGGQFSSTEVVARSSFIKQHPQTVTHFLTGLLDTLGSIRANPAAAQQAANGELGKLAGKSLSPAVLSSAWGDQTFTDDPLGASVSQQTQHAVSLGELKDPGNLDSLYNLGPLNALLKSKGHPPVHP